MTIDRLNQALTLFGNLAVIAGIIFLGLELQQSNQIAISEQERSRIEYGISLRNQMIEHAEVWVKCSDGKVLSQSEAVTCDSMIISLWGAIYAATTSNERFGDTRRVAIHDFASILYVNPGVRKRWISLMEQEQKFRKFLIPDSAGVELMQQVVSDLEKLDAAGL